LVAKIHLLYPRDMPITSYPIVGEITQDIPLYTHYIPSILLVQAPFSQHFPGSTTIVPPFFVLQSPAAATPPPGAGPGSWYPSPKAGKSIGKSSIERETPL